MKRLLALAFVLATGATGTAAASPPRLTVFSSFGVDVITYPADEPGYTFITDTLGGDGHPQHAAARHPAARPERGYTLITDTLAPGGRRTAQTGSTVITDTLAPGGGSARAASRQPGFSWPDVGIGAAAGAGLLLAVAGLSLLVIRRRVAVGA
jgi:hypothetical protein